MKSVLIVDDSFFVRSVLEDIINDSRDFTVVATASGGEQALELIRESPPDAVTLDVQMPDMDGLAVLRELRDRGESVPVIMVSAATQRQARTSLRALELGAQDVLPKPSDSLSKVKDDFGDKLLGRLRAVVDQEQPGESASGHTETGSKETNRSSEGRETESSDLDQPPGLLLIGGSTGAPPVLRTVLSDLPTEFPLPIVVVQHINEPFLSSLCENVNESTGFPTEQVQRPVYPEPGSVYFPTEDQHLKVRRRGQDVQLYRQQGEPVQNSLPSVDVLFQSAARDLDQPVIALLLTGMGKDGAAGMKELYDSGSVCLAQDEDSSTVFGMPGEASKLGAVDQMVPEEELGSTLRRVVGRYDLDGTTVR